jgi:hypothetical protein
MKARKSAKRLYGPTVQYADGTIVAGEALDIEHILAAFQKLGAEAKRAFFCIFAHELTVAIRALLLDRPVADADLDRVSKINEFLHQLTSCTNPDHAWSALDEADLIRSFIDTSFSYHLDRYIGHALAVAAGNKIGAGALRTEETAR